MTGKSPRDLALEIVQSRFADAAVTFWAGSLARGEGGPGSDIDLVVVFEEMDCPYRRSFLMNDQAVEIFAHDRASLGRFFEKDVEDGRPALLEMVTEGVALPNSSPFSEGLRSRAVLLLARGPRAWTQTEIDASRYRLTESLKNLRHAVTRHEAVAIATYLYGALFEHHRRCIGRWSAASKQIPRLLRRDEPDFASAFLDAFDALFDGDERTLVLELGRQVLEASGGELFDGFFQPALSR